MAPFKKKPLKEIADSLTNEMLEASKYVMADMSRNMFNKGIPITIGGVEMKVKIESDGDWVNRMQIVLDENSPWVECDFTKNESGTWNMVVRDVEYFGGVHNNYHITNRPLLHLIKRIEEIHDTSLGEKITGKEIDYYKCQCIVRAHPATYKVDGKRYILIWSNGDINTYE